MWILEIKYLEDWVISCLILSLNDRIVHAPFLNTHVIFKYCLAVKTDPCVRRAGHRNLDLRIFLHVFVHIFGAVGCGGAAPGGIHPDGAWLQPEAHHGRHVDLGRELSGAE